MNYSRSSYRVNSTMFDCATHPPHRNQHRNCWTSARCHPATSDWCRVFAGPERSVCDRQASRPATSWNRSRCAGTGVAPSVRPTNWSRPDRPSRSHCRCTGLRRSSPGDRSTWCTSAGRFQPAELPTFLDTCIWLLKKERKGWCLELAFKGRGVQIKVPLNALIYKQPHLRLVIPQGHSINLIYLTIQH